MKSILPELYEGKIFLAEQYSPRSEEYRKIYQEHYQHYDGFIFQGDLGIRKINLPLNSKTQLVKGK